MLFSTFCFVYVCYILYMLYGSVLSPNRLATFEHLVDFATLYCSLKDMFEHPWIIILNSFDQCLTEK